MSMMSAGEFNANKKVQNNKGLVNAATAARDAGTLSQQTSGDLHAWEDAIQRTIKGRKNQSTLPEKPGMNHPGALQFDQRLLQDVLGEITRRTRLAAQAQAAEQAAKLKSGPSLLTKHSTWGKKSL